MFVCLFVCLFWTSKSTLCHLHCNTPRGSYTYNHVFYTKLYWDIGIRPGHDRGPLAAKTLRFRFPCCRDTQMWYLRAQMIDVLRYELPQHIWTHAALNMIIYVRKLWKSSLVCDLMKEEFTNRTDFNDCEHQTSYEPLTILCQPEDVNPARHSWDVKDTYVGPSPENSWCGKGLIHQLIKQHLITLREVRLGRLHVEI